MERRADAALPFGTWLGGLAAIGLLVVVAFAAISWAPGDRFQQQGLVVGISHLDLFAAYDDLYQTSGPGFGLFAQPVYLLSRPFLTELQAFQLAGASTLVPLAVGAVAASRAIGVVARSAHELLLTGVVVLGVPTLACFCELWHPADVLATALCLGAFATQTHGRRVPTMVLLGAAIATRQWAVIPLALTLVLADRDDRLPLVLGSGAVAAVLVLPFLVANPQAVVEALGANDVLQNDLTVPGLVTVSRELRFVLSRDLPLLFTAVACGWLYWRKLRWDPELAAAAFAAVLLSRSLVDPAMVGYYLAPGAAFFTFMWRRSWAGPLGGFAAGLVLWLRLHTTDQFPGIRDRAPDAATSLTVGQGLAVATSVCFTVWVGVAVVRMRRRAGQLAEAGTPVAAAPVARVATP